ncbi:MAG: flagellar hook-length control protein FliK [Gammaproteobacteria bacterium]|nr:flagellar hook-length control protein FliK [Gammaproteobacteria bacterium]
MAEISEYSSALMRNVKAATEVKTQGSEIYRDSKDAEFKQSLHQAVAEYSNNAERGSERQSVAADNGRHASHPEAEDADARIDASDIIPRQDDILADGMMQIAMESSAVAAQRDGAQLSLVQITEEPVITGNDSQQDETSDIATMLAEPMAPMSADGLSNEQSGVLDTVPSVMPTSLDIAPAILRPNETPRRILPLTSTQDNRDVTENTIKSEALSLIKPVAEPGREFTMVEAESSDMFELVTDMLKGGPIGRPGEERQHTTLLNPVSLTQSESTISNSLNGANRLTFSLPPPASPAVWNDQFGDRIVFMSKMGLQEAQLQLSPPRLGQVDVRISIVDDTANIIFTVNSHASKDLVEQAMPRLRAMLAETGVNMGDVSVSDQSTDSRGQAGRDANRGFSEHKDELPSHSAPQAEELPVTEAEEVTLSEGGLLNTYA